MADHRGTGGEVVGASSTVQNIDLLAGAVDPLGPMSVATNGAGQPMVGVSVVSGHYNPSSIAYAILPNGTLSIDPAQFSGVATGTAVTL